MTLSSKLSYLCIVFALSGCSNSKDTPISGELEEPNQIPVWTDSSIKAELYLPSFSELENATGQNPAPIATVNIDSATPEQLAELRGLEVDRSFEYFTVICDVLAGYDVLYLVITDQDDSIRRFSQYSGCGFRQGEGFFQMEAEGFLSNQKICDFGLSFGFEGFLCSER